MTHASVDRHQSDVNNDAAANAQRSGGALVAYFQPFYNVRTDRLQGLEALARRLDASGQTAFPSGIFAGEDTALASPRELDRWILEESLRHMSRWHESDGRRDLILSVNFSWESLGSAEFVTDVREALYRYDIPGDRLLVDVSTDVFRQVQAAGDLVLSRIRTLQHDEITFCLDGFTAADVDLLPAAAEVPFDIVKLHPSQLTVGSEEDRARLGSLADAIHDASMPIVAAGIETVEELDVVRGLGFEWAQGFLLGEPVDAESSLSHPSSLPPH